MTKKDDGGPAFPHTIEEDGCLTQFHHGMTLRDWFAGQVINYLHVNPNLPDDPASEKEWPDPLTLANRRAKWAYLQADAMIEARK